MIAIVRSELLKIRTTAIPWVLAGVAVLVNGLFLLGVFLSKSDGGPGFDVPHTTQQLRDLLGSGFAGYLLTMVLGLLIITVEFRHKTVTTSFLVTPKRSQFVAGKLIAAAILGVMLAVLMLVVTLVAGGLTLSARGGSFGALVRQIPAVAPGFILVFALFALLGVGVGSILTNQVAALIVSLGWFLIVEQILVGLVPAAEKWVPTGAAQAAANLTRGSHNGGTPIAIFNWWQGTLLMLAYGLGFALIGSYILSRRDIT